MEHVDIRLVEHLRCQGKTYEEMSQHLKSLYLNLSTGLSARSVRRFCKLYDINKLSDSEVDSVVGDAVREVGEVYGRKMLKGYLQSRGITIGEHKLSTSLQRVAPDAYRNRTHCTTDRTNPRPYFAQYFGHKLHLDQNEKLVMYGVTHVLAIDGYSGKIVAYVTAAIKNDLIIYDKVWRTAVISFGLWHQLRVDCGTEFYLSLYSQAHLRAIYGPPDILPYYQTTSTQNLPIERIWPQVNSRVNYPMKRVLLWMEENGCINMTCEVTKFCVSFIAICVSSIGIERFVSSWNAHYISGKGVPNDLALNSQVTQVPSSLVPCVDAAALSYEENQGQLTREYNFGIDPLKERIDLVNLREQRFLQHFNFNDTFTNLISGNKALFVNSIIYFKQVTEQYSQLI